ncbi:MAG: malate dehydrogenase [Candidatus Nanohaloarchaea archaeon]|nr:malate dehydrogenase [Candidatus Nanohaloarchaea archaeon]
MKLTVVGAGMIGAGVAFNVAIRDVFDEIVLVDLDEEKAKGEALDVSHAISFHADTEIRQGTYEDAHGSDVVAVTAGKPRKEGMTRADLLEVNIDVIKAIHDNDFGDDATFVTTTNPMDVINYSSYRVADYDRSRFIGFGGWLDSARFQYVLANYFDEPAGDIRGYVIGEHGDTQVPVFSQVTVNGKRRDIPQEDRDELEEQMVQSAMDVISRKGYTGWAPTYRLSEMIETIAMDERRVYTCSCVLDGEYGRSGLSIGVPAVIGNDGIEEVIEWDLDDSEREEFEASAVKLEELCAQAEGMI